MAAQNPITSRFKKVQNQAGQAVKAAANPQQVAQAVKQNVGAEVKQQSQEALKSVGEQLGVPVPASQEAAAPAADQFNEQQYREQQERQKQQRLGQLRAMLEQKMAEARGQRVQEQQQYVQNVDQQFREQDLGGKTEEEYVQAQQMTDQEINQKMRRTTESGKRNRKG